MAARRERVKKVGHMSAALKLTPLLLLLLCLLHGPPRNIDGGGGMLVASDMDAHEIVAPNDELKYLISISNTNIKSDMPNIMKIFQKFACDGEQLEMRCDGRTNVNVIKARYGRPVTDQSQQCRNVDTLKKPTTTAGYDPGKIHDIIHGDKELAGGASGDVPCSESDYLRYLFMKHMTDNCQHKKYCSTDLTAANLRINTDPCPTVQKYAEVIFQCAPVGFYNKAVCENSPLHITCPPNERIVLFSVFFGASKSAEGLCPTLDSQTAYDRECSSPDAGEVVRKECHGRQRCSFVPTEQQLGRPACGENKRPSFHLRVIYTCTLARLVRDPEFGVPVLLSPPSSTASSPTANLFNILGTPIPTKGASTSSSSSAAVTAGVSPSTTAIALVPSVSTIDPDEVKRRIEEEEKILKAKMSENELDKGRGAVGGSGKDLADVIVTPGDDDAKPADGNDDDEEEEESLGDESTGMMGKIAKLEAQFIALEQKCNCTIMPPSIRMIGFLTEWMSAVNFIRRNKERMVLYMLLSFFSAMLIFITTMSLKIRVQKMLENRKVRDQQAEGQAPFNTFGTEADDDDDDDDDDEELQLGRRGGGRLVINAMGRMDDEPDEMQAREMDTFRNEVVELHHNHGPLYGIVGPNNGLEQYQPAFYQPGPHHHRHHNHHHHNHHHHNHQEESFEESTFTIPPPMAPLQHPCQHKIRAQTSAAFMLPGPTPEPTSFNTITPENKMAGNVLYVQTEVHHSNANDAIISMEAANFCGLHSSSNSNSTNNTNVLLSNFDPSMQLMSVVSTSGVMNGNNGHDDDLPPPPPPSVIEEHPYVIATSGANESLLPKTLATMPSLKDFSAIYGFVPEAKPLPPTTMTTLSNFLVQHPVGGISNSISNPNIGGPVPLKGILVNRSGGSHSESTPVTPGATSVTFNLEPVESVLVPLLGVGAGAGPSNPSSVITINDGNGESDGNDGNTTGRNDHVSAV